MNFRIICLLGIFCLLSQLSIASTMDSLRVETIDGKKYIVHRVESKETLFSIARRYDVKVVNIMDANPGTEDGIKIFQELLIPMEVKEEQPVKDTTTTVPVDSTTKTHIVQQGETLYGISRKYEISVDELKKWNNLQDNSLALGSQLIVAVKDSETIAEPTQPQQKPKPSTTQKASTDTLSNNMHTVAASETLYGISRKYNISVDELKKLNKLSGNGLEIGQVLAVGNGSNASIVEEKPKEIKKPEVKEEKQKIDTVYLATDNSRFKQKTEVIGNLEKTTEEGFATKIDGTAATKKYLALHRFVPIGTIIEVKNRMNNRSIFARVVGKLPETGMNKNVLIRVSNAAFDKLGALDAKIPVEIGYVLE